MLMRRAPFWSLVAFAALLIAGAPSHALAAKHIASSSPTVNEAAAEPAPAHEAEKAEPGLPQLDITLWPGQAFWLVISFLLTYLLMRYVAIPGVERTLDKRTTKLESDIEGAKYLNEQAKTLSADLDLRINDARTRAADSVRETIHQNAAKLAAAYAEQQKKLDAGLKTAEAELAAQKQKALAALDNEAAGMIEAILKRVTGTAPANDVLKSAWSKAKEA